ncbi:tRNA (guanosine(37)-N1)-methyltransferase TrmD [Candidatus Woesebacteria bacterium RIFCSPLOWO2_01_FULL_39_61]|uniref:tRNA (guanine-N(1)-)-methyltransferase n=1 Tax=Candidatus Woesebacteria bacterium RIFCSPHIGHO2_02_FULL_39_13 TaxID=1802505 RepID=A0A1F7Z412_9BACT|nr:MAG: tRNA (guanosine(37)-N1)-methyltransferase TrmD [Candidatus Woesebacteria bacterium RIFCSPHIGHO2_01_FULL_39_95]OGM33839.1 MAG: tRNA (guanosine(37)-N1)-methyltransferase TrmD [Candidatus Woesebacteria bacterium RIFCSPHIGHO2_02_FULL_39_13]OGM39000.1 MAG: tRNA (guanosine(37)-N1)-methyltransferase TrmD [Candidatus Woesebacteria bacterium RIFCSPHIGHO2_12_FULL_40_20]OGM67505.1 MAG: tRNA (guanosine(37)-N1)-methyltransferase TrmD [Candidatus Woesebacteria bacterium RIFCSPLOWO2_01_FULL_39_61]
MKIDILTLFPDMFSGPFATSMLKKAQDNGLVEISIHDLRNWATDKHKTVDGRPYGGGAGMILRVDIIDRALKTLKSKIINRKSKIILLSAKGKTFNQERAQEFSKLDNLILIAGHYEGVDERVAEHLVDEEISIGDYILTGGEIPAMVIVDAVVRLIPGVLNPNSLIDESYSSLKTRNLKIKNYTEYPQYTRPEKYHGWKVPEVLLSGNHKEIENWRREKSVNKIGKLFKLKNAQ